mmetsp:Transcript_21315/g.51529  ORF Transcript_21315/g.51529 Transcript_21315/m.51529 type:complete len:222 (+) Transcript_21315:971-1636(+)
MFHLVRLPFRVYRPVAQVRARRCHSCRLSSRPIRLRRQERRAPCHRPRLRFLHNRPVYPLQPPLRSRPASHPTSHPVNPVHDHPASPLHNPLRSHRRLPSPPASHLHFHQSFPRASLHSPHRLHFLPRCFQPRRVSPPPAHCPLTPNQPHPFLILEMRCYSLRLIVLLIRQRMSTLMVPLIDMITAWLLVHCSVVPFRRGWFFIIEKRLMSYYEVPHLNSE